MPTHAEETAPPTRVSPFAWWSVGLGVVAVLPCLWIYFVPAISGLICGVLAYRQVGRWKSRYHGRGVAITGMVLCCLSIAGGLTVFWLAATGVWEWPGTNS